MAIKHDIITIFNQLTSNELADCNLFRTIMEDHFMKFRYFYSLLENVKLSHVKTIIGITDISNLTITITPTENKYINEIIRALEGSCNDVPYAEYFGSDISDDTSDITITIYLSKFSEERELYYADRFI